MGRSKVVSSRVLWGHSKEQPRDGCEGNLLTADLTDKLLSQLAYVVVHTMAGIWSVLYKQAIDQASSLRSAYSLEPQSVYLEA
jgi:hypothetical protein